MSPPLPGLLLQLPCEKPEGTLRPGHLQRSRGPSRRFPWVFPGYNLPPLPVHDQGPEARGRARRSLSSHSRVPAVLTCPVVPQGGYDQSKTKVLHMSMNPASAAKQRLREDQARLQEECERLRELVRALERGGPVPADLEAAAGLPSSKEVAGRHRPPSVRHPVGSGPREGLGPSVLRAAGRPGR